MAIDHGPYSCFVLGHAQPRSKDFADALVYCLRPAVVLRKPATDTHRLNTKIRSSDDVQPGGEDAASRNAPNAPGEDTVSVSISDRISL